MSVDRLVVGQMQEDSFEPITKKAPVNPAQSVDGTFDVTDDTNALQPASGQFLLVNPGRP